MSSKSATDTRLGARHFGFKTLQEATSVSGFVPGVLLLLSLCFQSSYRRVIPEGTVRSQSCLSSTCPPVASYLPLLLLFSFVSLSRQRECGSMCHISGLEKNDAQSLCYYGCLDL